MRGADGHADPENAPRLHTRRWFLGSLGALLAGSLGWWGVGREWSASIRSLVARRLYFLDLDPAGLDAFARDAMADPQLPFPKHMHVRRWFFSLYSRVPVRLFPLLPARDRLAGLEARVVQKYLLSTDFFLQGADESVTVRYRAYFDPYRRPCVNPFL
ncbi:MAG: hypothetical protein OEY20_13970 [Gemmatimonadota bacterium]|nr:hypothetical protein [Gemmatimonadota bacterium]MDH5198345.1 hypothetical protein [Gemmatimonadota bacterium]